MEKLQAYQGWTGQLHEWRDSMRERFHVWREENPGNPVEIIKKYVAEGPRTDGNDDFSHIYRPKTRNELVKVSAAVMGIEFSYAAETAFVSPTLLSIGVQHQHMTLVWALSPLIGFFVTPILGSFSDRCRMNLGRRRPFIIILSIGIFIGLLLVPNGEDIGYAMGDFNPYADFNETSNKPNPLGHRSTASESELISPASTPHPWGIFFTIVGTVLLDFDADACQSPARAYLLDVTLPEDHARGLSTFTVMAGLGGFMGYSLGAINWEETTIGVMLGGHVHAVFTLVTIIFVICVSVTLNSFREIPLWKLESQTQNARDISGAENGATENPSTEHDKLQQPNKNGASQNTAVYGTLSSDSKDQTTNQQNTAETSFIDGYDPTIPSNVDDAENAASFVQYLMSIIFMPHSIRMVCLTNLFCWMAHVCYSLYFTDFVGEAVFMGDPRAPEGTESYNLYSAGVRFGCWGMAMYSLSCACYSLIIERLIKQFGAKHVYIGGLLFYSCGMCLMALTKAQASVIIFSWCAGVMYSTLFTMPYLLIANYHSLGTFELGTDGAPKPEPQVRGLGTDVAIVSSMVFLAQFILSICMGTIVTLSGTTTAVVSTASFLSFCGAICATQIMYLDL